MNPNPYPTPVAAVADAVGHAAARPRSVVIGVSLAAASLVIGAIRSVASPPPGSLLVGGVIMLFIAALVFAVWARRGWARWIFLVLFLLGLPVVFFIKDLLLQQGAAAVVIMVVQTILQGVALGYLFSPSSNTWFRTRRL